MKLFSLSVSLREQDWLVSSGSGSGSGSGGVLDGIRSSESEEKEGELLEMDMSGEPDKRKAQNRAA